MTVSPLSVQEIDRLKEEKRRLADRLHQAESTVKTVLEQKKQLQADVKEAQQRHQQEKEGRDGRASEVSGWAQVERQLGPWYRSQGRFLSSVVYVM